MFFFILVFFFSSIVLEGTEKKIGVLVVSHGSHSKQWREMLTDITNSARSDVMKNKNIKSVKSAFMEYTEPSIATRMKQFDSEGFSDVIVIRLLLTVSGHSFDDIPHILGLKSSQIELAKLKSESIEVYKAKAKITLTPLLNFPAILSENLIRRIKKLSINPLKEAVVMVAYGDKSYNEEWTDLIKDMSSIIEKRIGINHFEHSWCGHIVDYKTEPTTTAINKALAIKDKVLVLPVLLAVDEMFQSKIIGGAIENVKHKDRVIYKPDAILPDINVEKWIKDISNIKVKEILNKKN